MKTTDVMFSIAKKELTDRLRNRWIWTVAFLFAASGLVIAFFGTAPVGVAGIRGSGAAMASLMNLAVYLVPLLALILGCGAIIDEKRRGMLDLILVYPLSLRDYFLGTFLGYALALFLAVLTGMLLAGVALIFSAGVGIVEYLILIGLALALAVVFLGVSFFISILSKDRGRAVAMSVFVWIGFVFIFDLLLVGILILSRGEIPAALFNALLMLNPTDVFRILGFQLIGSTASPLGLSTAVASLPSKTAVIATLIFWVILPLVLSFLLFRKRVVNDNLV